ncbi:MAG: DUF4931 domain-containing protein [Clostridiales bacterium]|nr:DUF4931 domain-containing protein [Clostridiales bacterium]
MELKHNYLTGEWVLVSPGRLARPNSFKAVRGNPVDEKGLCPFCPENSFMILKYIYKSPCGRVAIVPNRYPAISEMSANGPGAHDVVIETPNHSERLAFFSQKDIYTYLEAIRHRVFELSQDSGIKYIQVFKNEGQKGGASIYHSHSQILAMPIIPIKQAIINSNFEQYHKENSKCYLCSITENLGNLMVFENNLFAAYSPYASNYAYGLNIAPKKHISDFKDFDKAHLIALAEVFHKVLPAYCKLFDNFSYNICFQNAPYNKKQGYNHFFIEIVPRMGQLAGFELSTGCFINPVDVYLAASEIRGLIDEN